MNPLKWTLIGMLIFTASCNNKNSKKEDDPLKNKSLSSEGFLDTPKSESLEPPFEIESLSNKIVSPPITLAERKNELEKPIEVAEKERLECVADISSLKDLSILDTLAEFKNCYREYFEKAMKPMCQEREVISAQLESLSSQLQDIGDILIARYPSNTSEAEELEESSQFNKKVTTIISNHFFVDDDVKVMSELISDIDLFRAKLDLMDEKTIRQARLLDDSTNTKEAFLKFLEEKGVSLDSSTSAEDPSTLDALYLNLRSNLCDQGGDFG